MTASRGDRQGDTPRRRLPGRGPAARPGRSDAERIAAVAAGADVPVEDVLREVADFRLALETDMIIAAAAADADNPEILSEVLDGERMELATFQNRLLERLADAAADDELALRRRRAPRARVGRLSRAAAAAAALVAVLGVGRTVVSTGEVRQTSSAKAIETADQHYANFSSAIKSDSPVAVREAAQQLHRTLTKLIEDHASDPEAAQQAAQLLQAEINLLQVTDPEGASHVLAQARGLVSMLERSAPPQVRKAVKPVLDAVDTPKPKPSSSPKPKATPSPKPKPTQTPRSSQSPSGSTSPDPNPLDTP